MSNEKMLIFFFKILIVISLYYGHLYKNNCFAVEIIKNFVHLSLPAHSLNKVYWSSLMF